MSLFFFNDTATTEIYTLSLHDALPIFLRSQGRLLCRPDEANPAGAPRVSGLEGDRKSTRLNSSHLVISYAVFCLKKKIIPTAQPRRPTLATGDNRLYHGRSTPEVTRPG